MNREIKFRLWDKQELNMVGPDDEYAILLSGEIRRKTDDYPPAYTTWKGSFTNEDFVLMQFTGLLDKQGKEIYEGDILEETRHLYRPPSILKHEVGWSDYHCGFEPFCLPDPYGEGRATDPEDCEVIGNIYEKKEG